ncbi:MAG: hypothetical protein IPJ89_05370 [Candidatus Iainarchaeum archaeon]|uniref:Uncharacterized protein n=1 Tax=Candidatus Iainarchaeum sp. TaxID=3101447 RepID=A0A7T9DJS1_9ARCH|nr:MAG: hypothetical protein IPJ89_05370 [Candidatus Diapherotrites archaeon]
MKSAFQHLVVIAALMVGIILLSTPTFAQATPVLRCGESQALGAYVGPFVGLINILGTNGSATVNGIPSVRTMTNAHAEDASTQTAYSFINGGVELGCKLENAPAGVSLNNNGTGSATTILRLSTPTNAHVEIPSAVPANYPVPIRLGVVGGGSILLREVIGGGSCNVDETLLVRLYAGTNAHAESPNFTPANYTTATSYSICLKYSSSGPLPGTITDIVATDIGITPLAGTFPTGTNTFAYTQTAPAGTPTPVYVDAYINKTALPASTNTGAQEILILCVKGGTYCDSIVANFTHPDFYNTTAGPPYLPNSLQGILMASGGSGEQIGLFSAPYGAGLPLAGIFPSNVFTVDLPQCPYLESITPGACGFVNQGINQLRVADIHEVLDTGSFTAFGNTYTVFPSLPAAPYTMRVISAIYPAFTTEGGTPYSETGASPPTTPVPGVSYVLNSLFNNADAAEINVSPAGTTPSATIQDIVEVQLTLQNFGPTGNSYTFGNYPNPAPLITNITRTVPGVFSTDVETINVWVVCNPNDTTPWPASPQFPFANFGEACQSIQDAATLLGAVQSEAINNTLFPGFRQISFWGDQFHLTNNYTQVWLTNPSACDMRYPTPPFNPIFTSNNWTTCPNPDPSQNPQLPPPIANGPPSFGVGFRAFNPPASTPVGSYRILSATFPATVVIGGNNYSEGIPTFTPTINPFSTGMANNFAATTFTVLPAGTTPTTCNNNNICEPALGEDPVTCPNDCKVSTPGDVYVLKDISLPQRYKGEQVDVVLTIESKKATPNSTQVEINVKDKDGKTLPGFPDIRTIGFSGTLTNGVEAIALPPVVLESAATPANITFKAGETYTLYARVKPYDDPSNNAPSVTFDESVLANNSAFKTFTVPEAPQTFSVPDQPWWMSIIVVAGLLGWMFIAGRKN